MDFGSWLTVFIFIHANDVSGKLLVAVTHLRIFQTSVSLSKENTNPAQLESCRMNY
jgi:hypothetical protein